MAEEHSNPAARAAQAASATTKAGADALGKAARSAADTQAGMINDFTRMFSDLKFPAPVDVQALMSAHKRNMEVLSAANRLALEGAQAVARRHMEIMQQTMAELGEQMRELASAEAPQTKAARQADLVKRSYERAIANMRELGDLIQRANGDALQVLNQRFGEAMEEVKGMMQKSAEQMPNLPRPGRK